MMTELDTRPTRFGVGLAGVFAMGVLFATSGVVLSLVPGAIGLVVLVWATARASKPLVTLGASGLLLGVLTAGLGGVGSEPLLIGTGCVVLAWDAGVQAVDIGATLGRTADTTRAFTVHTMISVVAVATTTAIGYAVFSVVNGGQPITALVLLLFGALVLGAAFRG